METLTATIAPSSSATELLAFLPAQALHVAAQFTAKPDTARDMLRHVHVFNNANTIHIEATDGHRAFRMRIANSDLYHCDGSLLIKAEAFKKRIASANFAIFKDDGIVEILGGKGTSTDLMEARPWKADADWNFPNISQLWPGKFTNAPGAPIRYNARLLGEFLAQVSRYSSNGLVQMETNSPTSPLVFTSDCEIHGCTDAELEFLLMPCQVRK
jgi:hypothetical protein